jgi:hypothetical protein
MQTMFKVEKLLGARAFAGLAGADLSDLMTMMKHAKPITNMKSGDTPGEKPQEADVSPRRLIVSSYEWHSRAHNNRKVTRL